MREERAGYTEAHTKYDHTSMQGISGTCARKRTARNACRRLTSLTLLCYRPVCNGALTTGAGS